MMPRPWCLLGRSDCFKKSYVSSGNFKHLRFSTISTATGLLILFNLRKYDTFKGIWSLFARENVAIKFAA
jgi:hypothetical protein